MRRLGINGLSRLVVFRSASSDHGSSIASRFCAGSPEPTKTVAGSTGVQL